MTRAITALLVAGCPSAISSRIIAAQSRQACLLASTLAQAKIVGKPVQFDDRTGYDALLLQGRYPQKHMKNRTGRELCLYHRQSGKAVVSEDRDRLVISDMHCSSCFFPLRREFF
ncbi:hypothetical protein CRX72_10180 [Pantoea sp. BRM17]|nr:hypothetical protein CRX72_10180 [Pantoea sp. BRM17]